LGYSEINLTPEDVSMNMISSTTFRKAKTSAAMIGVGLIALSLQACMPMDSSSYAGGASMQSDLDRVYADRLENRNDR
jgi:hypothetical protein